MENVEVHDMAPLAEKCFRSALYRKNENTADGVEVEGITRNVKFHPERLEAQKATVKSILKKLPEEFKDASKGCDFTEMRFTGDGNTHWTETPYTCEKLLLLAMGLDLMQYTTPRDHWGNFPNNGIPYVAITA